MNVAIISQDGTFIVRSALYVYKVATERPCLASVSVQLMLNVCIRASRARFYLHVLKACTRFRCHSWQQRGRCCLQTPPFEQALPGITIMRLMDLIPEVRFGPRAPAPAAERLFLEERGNPRQAGVMIQDTTPSFT